MSIDACTCCGRPWDRCPFDAKRQRFRGPPRDPDGICRDCIPHAGFGMRAASDHVPLWRAYVDALTGEWLAQVEQEKARTAAAIAELVARPETVVEKWINEQEVAAARAEADRAFRSREIAWRALSALGVLHTELPGGTCRCAKARRLCEAAAVVDGVAGLRAWEAKQAAEHRARRPHYLPDGHPALIDHRWSGGAPEDWELAGGA